MCIPIATLESILATLFVMVAAIEMRGTGDVAYGPPVSKGRRASTEAYLRCVEDALSKVITDRRC